MSRTVPLIGSVSSYGKDITVESIPKDLIQETIKERSLISKREKGEEYFDVFGNLSEIMYKNFIKLIRPSGRPFVDISNGENMIEIIDFMVEYGKESGNYEEVFDLLKEYSKNENFKIPWDLSTMKEYHINYISRSDPNKIMGKGIKVKTMCPTKGCGWNRVLINLIQTRSLDEAATEIRTCTKCGNVRK